jgi:hypothetical protein
MGASTERVYVDGEKLMELVFGAVEEGGGTLDAALVVMGDTLGLYGFRRVSGAEPGEARIRDVVRTVGFSGLRRGVGTPFGLALEARP